MHVASAVQHSAQRAAKSRVDIRLSKSPYATRAINEMEPGQCRDTHDVCPGFPPCLFLRFRPCDLCARVRPCVPCVPCVSRLPPGSFYQ